MFQILIVARKSLKGEDGATMVEYAFMLLFIALVCFSAVKSVGLTTASFFPSVSASL